MTTLPSGWRKNLNRSPALRFRCSLTCLGIVAWFLLLRVASIRQLPALHLADVEGRFVNGPIRRQPVNATEKTCPNEGREAHSLLLALNQAGDTGDEKQPSAFLVEAIHEREQQLRDITDQLLAGGTDSVDAHLSGIRTFVTQRLGDLRTLRSGDPVSARKELLKHVSEIRMVPQAGDGNERPHYVAEGSGDLLGGEKEKFAGVASRQIRVVAGACNAPNLLSIPFSRPLVALGA
jgi:hypothetical protein